MDFLTAGLPHNCPVEGCPGRGNKYRDAGTLFPPACRVYCAHFGGGKPPPHTLPTLQHDDALECSEQESYCHRPVRQGGGKEGKAGVRGGTEGEIGEVMVNHWRM